MRKFSCISVAMLATITVPMVSEAAYQRLSATYCVLNDPTQSNYQYSGGYLRNIGTTTAQVYYCAFPDNTTYVRTSISGVNAHVWDASTTDNVTATACISDYLSFSTSCGTAVSTSGSGSISALSLSSSSISVLSSSSNSDWFAMLEGSLPAASGTNASALLGFFVSYP